MIKFTLDRVVKRSSCCTSILSMDMASIVLRYGRLSIRSNVDCAFKIFHRLKFILVLHMNLFRLLTSPK